MFGWFKSKQADALDHWYVLVPGFQFSTTDFYAGVEQELQARKVPGLEMSRVEFAEGGLLSDKRLYLRMLRERLVFDVCAAPFGTSYFFSCRFAEIPLQIKLWELAAFVIGILIFSGLFLKIFDFVLGTVLLIALLIAGVWLMRNALALGMKDLDATLIKTPVIGPIYECFFRRETYYRQDTRLMYLDTVNAVVKAKVEEVTGAKGIKLIRFNEHSPILGELYKAKTVELNKASPPAA